MEESGVTGRGWSLDTFPTVLCAVRTTYKQGMA
jgi:hypothetical protein